MAYVRHKAIDNSLKGHRLSIQYAERSKRQNREGKFKNHVKSVDNKFATTTSMQSRPSVDFASTNSPRIPLKQRKKSTDQNSVVHSRGAT